MRFRIGKIVFWLALAIYFGGLLILGVVVAPTLFHTVRETNAVMISAPAGWHNPDQLGGEIFGNILRTFSMVEVASLVLMGVGLTLTAGAGSPRLRRIQALLLMLVTILTGFDMTMTNRQVWQERAAWRAAATQSTTEAATHKARFDVLHKRSEATGKAKVFLLLALLAVSSQADFIATRKEKKSDANGDAQAA